MDKLETLKHYFGYTSFRPAQESIIDSILSGRDVLAVMPTGAGKSICYQIPGLMLPGITLVVSPLISLMIDQVRALNEAGVHAAYINSSLTEGQIAKALGNAERGDYKIIYVAPERLESRGFLHFLDTASVSLLTVDEAHCISQWGQDFRPSYLNIIKAVERMERRPVVAAFTATATGMVREDILCVLKLRSPKVEVTGFDRKNLYFEVRVPQNKQQETLSFVKAHHKESGIIYCATRKNVEKVYDFLNRCGIKAAKYHAGMSAEDRAQNQNAFIYDEKQIVVATNAFGMGIDKSNVRYVLHYNMPQSIENYYQEAGRAGRDGERAECVLLYSAQDVRINRFLIENKQVREREVQEELLQNDLARLRSMVGYCTTKECLRVYLLNYFGEKSGACENCSNCLTHYETVDITECSRHILQCVSEVRERFGFGVIAGILRGERSKKLLSYGFDRLASFGLEKTRSESYLRQALSELTQRGILCVTDDKYAVIKKGPNTFLPESGGIQMKMFAQKETQIKRKEKFRISDNLTKIVYELFDILKEERLKIARREGVPPYVVASDKTLVDMCLKIPFDREEMLYVYGMGRHKTEKYGQIFSDIIKAFTNGRREVLHY